MKGEGKCAPVQKKNDEKFSYFHYKWRSGHKTFLGVSEVNRLTATPTQLKLTVGTLNTNAATSSRNSSEDSAKLVLL